MFVRAHLALKRTPEALKFNNTKLPNSPKGLPVLPASTSAPTDTAAPAALLIDLSFIGRETEVTSPQLRSAQPKSALSVISPGRVFGPIADVVKQLQLLYDAPAAHDSSPRALARVSNDEQVHPDGGNNEPGDPDASSEAACCDAASNSGGDSSDEAFVLVTKRHGRQGPVQAQPPRGDAASSHSEGKAKRVGNSRQQRTTISALVAAPAYRVPKSSADSLNSKPLAAAAAFLRKNPTSASAPTSTLPALVGLLASVTPAAPMPSILQPVALASQGAPSGRMSIMAAAISAGLVPDRRGPLHQPTATAAEGVAPPEPRKMAARLNPAAAAWQPSNAAATRQSDPERVAMELLAAGVQQCLISRLPVVQVSGCECAACSDYAVAVATVGRVV